MGDDDLDPYAELERELRRGVGAEWRDEAEIVERETELGRLRRRSLADVVTEAMHRGDRVVLGTRAGDVIGDPVFVGTDYVAVRSEFRWLDVPLERATIRIERRAGGGHTTRGGSRTFKARLAEYEHTGEPITLHLGGTADVTGRVAVAAGDHCVVTDTDEREIVVPLASIDLVSRPRS